jgi:hypothetical protein
VGASFRKVVEEVLGTKLPVITKIELKAMLVRPITSPPRSRDARYDILFEARSASARSRPRGADDRLPDDKSR